MACNEEQFDVVQLTDEKWPICNLNVQDVNGMTHFYLPLRVGKTYMYGYQIIQSTLHYLFLLRFYVNFCAIVVKCKEKKLKEQEIQERIVLNTFAFFRKTPCMYLQANTYFQMHSSSHLLGAPASFIWAQVKITATNLNYTLPIFIYSSPYTT